MVQDEVKDKLNGIDKTDTSDIDILPYYWKCHNRILMVKVTVLYTIFMTQSRLDM